MIDQYKQNGMRLEFEAKHKTLKEPIYLTVSTRITNEAFEGSSPASIKSFVYQDFANQFGEKIVKEGLMRFEVKPAHSYDDPFGYETFMEGTICIAPMGTKKVVITEKMVSIEDKDFTQEEVMQALLNQYPERFI